jgi:glycine dehydrogenase subunit 1
VVTRLAEYGVLGGVPLSRFYPGRDDLADILLVAATETATEDDVSQFESALREVLR